MTQEQEIKRQKNETKSKISTKMTTKAQKERRGGTRRLLCVYNRTCAYTHRRRLLRTLSGKKWKIPKEKKSFLSESIFYHKASKIEFTLIKWFGHPAHPGGNLQFINENDHDVRIMMRDSAETGTF